MRSVEEMTEGVMSVIKKNEQADAQMREEAKQIITKFLNEFWQRVVPKAVPPISADGVIHQRNYGAFAAALNAETVLGKGKRPVRHDVLADIVAAIDKQGLLDHFNEAVVRIVEIEKKVAPTRKEAAKAAADLTREMNKKDRSPIQGFGPVKDNEPQPPRATQAQLEAQARNDLRQNEIMGHINASIAQHRGKSHGATDAERKILQGIRDAGIDAGLDNAVILEQIEAKRNDMVKWDGQRAIREVYAAKFRERGVDISQRTPSKYGE